VFVRVKPSGGHKYLQVVKNYREGRKVKQKVLGTLGRVDELVGSQTLDNLARSLLRFSENLKVVEAHENGVLEAGQVLSIGPALVFDRLWHELGLERILSDLLEGRKFSFAVQRAVFLTVVHRLFAPGSDRQAQQWKEDFRIEGVEGLELHHFYRAMAWLGEALPLEDQAGATGFACRCTKDLIEERLFDRHRDLFSSLELVFFDTTSLYFEGDGGESLGQRGHSKDHRPDLKQMVVAAVLDGSGRPICCEMWPGNSTDVKSLLPVIGRLKSRFGIESMCVVADRGMISEPTISELESAEPPLHYILGVRMRKSKEVKEQVVAAEGQWQQIYAQRQKAKDPAPLKVREVGIEGRRYIVCLNEEQAVEDAAKRQAIVEGLQEKLQQCGDKSLVGNKGYRKYLKAPKKGDHFAIDEKKIEEEQRYDGKWVLRTNTDLSAEEVALKYKQLWMVEKIFRTVKSVLGTRPVYHKYDATIRGHVFCSFLALVLAKELEARLEAKEKKLEWDDIVRDLIRLREVEVNTDSGAFFLRTELRGGCVDVLRAAGVVIPPSVRRRPPE